MSSSIDVFFVNSSSMEGFSLDEFRMKFYDLCSFLVERYGRSRVTFFISDDDAGYHNTLKTILEDLQVNIIVTETDWKQKTTTFGILQGRDKSIISKIVRRRQEIPRRFSMILAIESASNSSGISFIRNNLAASHRIPYCRLDQYTNIDSFLENPYVPDRKRPARENRPQQTKRQRNITSPREEPLQESLFSGHMIASSSSSHLPENIEILTDREIFENPEYEGLRAERMLPTIDPPEAIWNEDGSLRTILLKFHFVRRTLPN
jgi:hypothetical protein